MFIICIAFDKNLTNERMKIMKKIAQVIVLTLIAVLLCTTQVKADGEGITVYFYNALGWEDVYVYSWTGESNAPELTPMEAMEKKNWYKFTFAESMGDTVEFLFYNGTWGDTNQTQNLVIENGKDMYYYATKTTVNNGNSFAAEVRAFEKKNDLTADYKQYRKEQKTAKENSKTAKIYFRNDKEWKSVFIWAWKEADGSNIFKSKFPGEKMEKYNEEWYVYTLETEGAFKCIFSNGKVSNKQQTGDSEAIMPGGTYWITIAGDNKVEANEDGLGAGSQVAINRSPQVGWPEGKQLTAEEIESSKEAGKIANKQASKKKNSGASALPFALGVIVIIVIGVLVNNNHKKNNTLA